MGLGPGAWSFPKRESCRWRSPCRWGRWPSSHRPTQGGPGGESRRRPVLSPLRRGNCPLCTFCGPGPGHLAGARCTEAWLRARGWGAVLSLHFLASLGKLGRESLMPSGLCPGSSPPPAPSALGRSHPLTCCASGQALTGAQVTALGALDPKPPPEERVGDLLPSHHLSCRAKGESGQGRASAGAPGTPPRATQGPLDNTLLGHEKSCHFFGLSLKPQARKRPGSPTLRLAPHLQPISSSPSLTTVPAA